MQDGTKRKNNWPMGVVMSLLVATTGAIGLAQDDTTTTTTTTTTESALDGSEGGPPTQAPYDEMAVNEDAAMLIRTLSEERAEIRQLAAQQAAFKRMGGRRHLRIASMLGRWIREHKAAGPKLEALILRHTGDPRLAVPRESPVLGPEEQMLMATHQDHQKAVINSQARWGMTKSRDIKAFMHKRASMARKHMRQMAPYMRQHTAHHGG